MATNRLKSLYFRHRNIVSPSSNPYLRGLTTSNADGLISTLGSYSRDSYLWCIIGSFPCQVSPLRTLKESLERGVLPRPSGLTLFNTIFVHLFAVTKLAKKKFLISRYSRDTTQRFLFFFLRSWIQSFRIQLERNSPIFEKIAQGY